MYSGEIENIFKWALGELWIYICRTKSKEIGVDKILLIGLKEQIILAGNSKAILTLGVIQVITKRSDIQIGSDIKTLALDQWC